VAWPTTALTARVSGPAAVHVSGIRQRLEVATVPDCDTQHGIEVCRSLFGDRFHPSPDLLAVTLSNLNPPVHMANTLCNFTRIEKGEDWENYGGITPAVARLIEALDAERLALAASFGLNVRSVRDHFAHSFGVPLASLAEMAAAVYIQRPGLLGPQSLDTRYVTEDVPFGLVPLTALSRSAEVEMPLHRAGIALFSALYGRDFCADNDILPALGLAELDRKAIHERARGGWPQ
jgi:opine dehydrogenase